MSASQLRSICVFCGSSPGLGPAYAQAARNLGWALARSNLSLVYGAGNVGLMGVLANAVLEKGGTVVGVIPQFLADKELAHPGLSEIHVVETMHERKALMIRLADAFVVLPGGIGTLEEFFEVWTWAQLGLLAKPIGLLNVENIFAPLLGFIKTLVEQRFMKPVHGNLPVVAQDPDELLTRLSESHWDTEDKWIDRTDA